MNALDEVIKWANNDLQPWQADAVRRLLASDSLSEDDIAELVYFVKMQFGLPCVQKETKPIPPKKGEVSGAGTTESSLILQSITCKENVNAIPNGTKLPIGHEGLTIIYGENGAGKSGFARTLKRACNARDKNEALLGNVYSSQFKTASKVIFSIKDNDSLETDIEWIEGTKNSELSKISVFDSKCARILLDKKNEFQYKPYGTHVFEELVSVLKTVKLNIEKEKPKTNKPVIEKIRPGTSAESFYDTLSSKTTDQELLRYSLWNESEDNELHLLIEWGDENKRSNFKQKIDTNKGVVKKFVSIMKDMRHLRFQLRMHAKETVNIAITNFTSAQNAHKHAKLSASNEKFPLSGVRSDMWKILYEAAEKYSTEEAYIGSEFPNIGNEAKCVLCMQELSETAKERLQKFSYYMIDETEKTLRKAKSIIETSKSHFNSLQIKSKSDIDALLIEIQQSKSSISSHIVNVFDSLRSAKAEIQSGLNNMTLIDCHNDVVIDCSEILTWLKSIQKETREIEKLQDPEKTQKNEQRGRELLSKKKVVERFNEIKKYVSDLKLIDKYDNCIGSLDGRSISTKGKSIINSLCTPELKQALNEEFEKLNIHSLKICIKASGSNGITQHELEISGAQGKQSPSDILSEGEQKVVSIAGFFAELHVANHACPIVFDDPVTSVDHIYKRKIAERIALESKLRQVIVFTHDIVFLMELEKILSELPNSKLAVITVRKKNGIPGCVDSGKPWNTMQVKERFTYLNDSINTFKDLETTNQIEYDNEAANWYCLLRETWESMVEESLFNGVIKRFGYEIKTQSIKEIEITDDDYAEIEKHMGKSSEWMYGHDKSKALDVHRPPISELRDDLSAARNFIKQVNNRKVAIRERRKLAMTPQRPQMG